MAKKPNPANAIHDESKLDSRKLTIESVGEPLGSCPSCGKTISVTLATHPDDPKKRQVSAMLHPMPFCTYYAENSAEQIADDMLRADQETN